MPTLTIRNVPEETKKRLRIRAAENGRSMEAEVRDILAGALARAKPAENLGDTIHRRFAAIGGFEMPEIIRGPAREPPDFSE